MLIYDYTDYRKYLIDYYEFQKKNNSRFSYQYFSKKAELGGKNYFQMVMKGARNLSPNTIQKFIKALKLDEKEAGYFENLVLFNQAKKENEKDLYFERLLKFKPEQKITELEKKKYLYLTNKYLVILREMISLPHFKEDYDWISQALNKGITPEQVKKAFNVLIKLNLLKRDEKGLLKNTYGTVETSGVVESFDAYKFYRSILNDATKAIISVPHDRREVASLTIPMDEDLLPKIKDIIMKSTREIAILINKEAKKFDEVYQLSSVFFPVTQTKEEEK